MEAPLPRETGGQKSGKFCEVCGEERPAVTSKYGSVIAGACPCSTAQEEESHQLEAQLAAADVDPPVDEPVERSETRRGRRRHDDD